MNRQIVDPDPGLDDNAAISTGNPQIEMKKNIYIAAVWIVIGYMIQFFDLKIRSSRDKIWITKLPKNALTTLEAQSKAPWVFSPGSRNYVTSSPTPIALCAVVSIEIACSNACRNAGILSMEILFFFASVIRETSTFYWRKSIFGG